MNVYKNKIRYQRDEIISARQHRVLRIHCLRVFIVVLVLVIALAANAPMTVIRIAIMIGISVASVIFVKLTLRVCQGTDASKSIKIYPPLMQMLPRQYRTDSVVTSSTA